MSGIGDALGRFTKGFYDRTYGRVADRHGEFVDKYDQSENGGEKNVELDLSQNGTTSSAWSSDTSTGSNPSLWDSIKTSEIGQAIGNAAVTLINDRVSDLTNRSTASTQQRKPAQSFDIPIWGYLAGGLVILLMVYAALRK